MFGVNVVDNCINMGMFHKSLLNRVVVKADRFVKGFSKPTDLKRDIFKISPAYINYQMQTLPVLFVHKEIAN